ncbi:MAG TPA: hypothetical protein VM166_15530 [Gemmatimonadaceae bacterium]|nr:hypothetical protein [Gemmatimonadaceae bacterium]
MTPEAPRAAAPNASRPYDAAPSSVAAGFCASCIAESSVDTPGDVNTYNGIGRKFYGGKAPCATCGSVLRTLWWTLIDIPVVPLGTYRYKTIAEDGIQMKRFWARKTRTHWDQVVKTWLVGWLIAAAALAAIGIYKSRSQ